jgi:damage-control phosphatase, subfamily I
MRTYLDCYPCFVRQALDAARFAGVDEDVQLAIVRDTMALIRDLDPATTPPEIGDQIHRQVREMVDDLDPYHAVKDAATEEALKLYPWAQVTIADHPEPLMMALRLAIAGNIIDFGFRNDYDLTATVREALNAPLAVNDVTALWEVLTEVKANNHGVLYLADNAGETVFDRALIEILDVDVTYAVKGGPVLNDATRNDALQAGLDSVATVIETGDNAPGTLLARTSADFRRQFDAAKVIIAKGQANYETLSPGDPRVFFVLKAKCPVIARDLGVEVGAMVVKQGQAER